MMTGDGNTMIDHESFTKGHAFMNYLSRILYSSFFPTIKIIWDI